MDHVVHHHQYLAVAPHSFHHRPLCGLAHDNPAAEPLNEASVKGKTPCWY